MKTEEKKQTMKNSVGRAFMAAFGVVLQVYWIVTFAIKLNSYYAVLSTATSFVALILVFRIYGETYNSAYKMSWIVLILAFPILGVCLFVLFGNEGSTAMIRHHLANIDTQTDKLLNQKPDVLEHLKKDRRIYNQSWYLWKKAGFPVYQNTDVRFYKDTCEALEAQKEELKKAEKFIFMEYHAIQDSTAWAGIEAILKEKAASGVDVRVFYDDMGSIGFLSKPFVKRLQSESIRCKVFNPVMPVLNVFMNNRDHRKITVIDGKVGFTGGYNLADEYFNLTHPYGQWKDSGIRLEGEAVRSLTVIFLRLWSALEKEKEDLSGFFPEVSCDASAQGFVQPYSDSPLDGERTGENVYLNLIKGAQDYVYITTPYLIIDDEMKRELTMAAERGVDVRIVTPGIPDKKLIYSVTRSYYAGLATRGVRIYEYEPGFIHAKQFLADGEIAAVGTINLDFRSLYLHFENGCLFYDCPAVADVKTDFDELFEISREVTGKYSAKQNVAVRGVQCILRLFSPLM